MASRYCWCYRDCWLSNFGNYNKQKCLQFKQAKLLYRQSSLYKYIVLYGMYYCVEYLLPKHIIYSTAISSATISLHSLTTKIVYACR